MATKVEVPQKWKKPAIAVLIAAVIIAAFLVIRNIFFPSVSNTLYIAVMAPLTGNSSLDGTDTINGVQLLIDQVNAEGGINGKRVEMIPYDDANNPDQAYDQAIQMVKDNQALVVIGHAFSSSSVRAGGVYSQVGIPAITGSATAGSVTADNPWYFRVIPNSRSQSAFLANYILDIFGQKQATVIYDQDAFGTTLKDPFVSTFTGLGGEIKAVYGFDGDADDLDQQLADILDQLVQTQGKDPGAVYLAVHAPEGVQLIVDMKREGLDVPIYGPSAFTNIEFLADFKEYPEEQAQPGFFSDGVYAIAPVVYDVAGKTGQEFRDRYLHYLDENPVPEADSGVFPGMKGATNYDAALMAIEAMRNTDISGHPNDRASDRQKIRDYLAGINSIDKAVEGVTGVIFFDTNGDVVKPVSIGKFQEGRLISAMTQLQPVIDIQRVDDLEGSLQNGDILIVDSQYMYKTGVSYTGVDIIEISNLNDKNGTYTMDFYIWFRYPENVTADEIEFLNAAGTISLAQPLDEALEDGVYYRAYRVKGDFAGDFYFEDYPFDHQKLTVKFRHTSMTRDHLIYVRDDIGMDWTTTDDQVEKLRRTNAFGEEGTWKLRAVDFFSDILLSESTLGNPNFYNLESNIQYSRFNAEIEIQRAALSFVIKNMLPLFAVVILAYLSIFLPPDQFATKNAIDRGALLTVAFFHIKLSNDLPGIGYTVALDWVFYVMYALIVGNLILSAVIRDYAQKDKQEMAQPLVIAGKIIYPAVVLTGIAFYIYTYNLISLPSLPSISLGALDNSTEATATAEAALLPETEDVVLRLGSWRTQDQMAMEQILATFNESQTGITVVFEPTDSAIYPKVLQSSLTNGNAPDLFYVYPFTFMDNLIGPGYVAPLGDLPEIENNYNPEILSAWGSETGEPYALPMMAVSYGVYYNADIFAELEISPPTTWEELLTAADTLSANGYLPFANGSKDAWTVEEIIFKGSLLANFIDGETGRMAYLAGEQCFNDADMIAAFNAVEQLAPYFYLLQSIYSYQDTQQAFWAGDAAMMMDGSWTIASTENQQSDFNWSIFAMPAPENSTTTLVFNPEFGIALNAASEYPEEARIFLEWLMSSETLALYQDLSPGLFALNNQPPLPENPKAQTFFELSQLHATDILWDLPSGLPDGNLIMQQEAITILDGETTPRRAANALQNGMAQWYEPAQLCEQK